MPGKVNPVIPEAVAQAAMAVMGHDQVIVQACAAGNLELNQFLPAGGRQPAGVARPADGGLRHLRPARASPASRPTAQRCLRNVQSSTATLTALIERIGYEAAEHLAEHAAAVGDPLQTIRRFVLEHGMLTAEEFDELTRPIASPGWARTTPPGRAARATAAEPGLPLPTALRAVPGEGRRGIVHFVGGQI